MRLQRKPLPKRAAGLAAFMLALGSVGILAAQDAQIRTRIDLVVVPVSVRDHNRHQVAGLTEADFSVFEDGRKQDIVTFGIDAVPMSAAVLIDTALAESSFAQVKDSFAALAAAFSPMDEVAVFNFDSRVSRVIDFTSDSVSMVVGLKTLKETRPSNPTMPSGPFSSPGPVINGIPVLPGGASVPRSTPSRKKALHDAIYTAADELSRRSVERRKVIFIVTDAQDKGSAHSLDETVNRLLDRGVQVFGAGMDMAYLSRSRSALETYVERTGGDACYVNSMRALERCYSQSMEGARYQYVLGYVSSLKATGRYPVFREIKVNVARADTQTAHRKGYFQYPVLRP